METNVTTAGKKQEAPVMDFRNIGARPIETLGKEELKEVGKQLMHKAKSCGFVGLTNHGLPLQFMSKLQKPCHQFFSQSSEEKAKHIKNVEILHGYTNNSFEKLGAEANVFDQKETFDITSLDHPFPDNIPELKEAAKETCDVLFPFIDKIFLIVEAGLDFQPGTLKKMHTKHLNGLSTLRFLEYHPVPNAKLGSVRCGAHTDFTSFTIQFQSDVGGFQVFHENEWKNADADPGIISLFFGDSMEMWTSGQIPAAKHRVIITDEEKQRHQIRNSIIFFVHADFDVILQALDGSNKYEPIRVRDLVDRKIAQHYTY